MTVIAMTREMGTRGKDVAKQLVDRLGLRLVHPEVIGPSADERTISKPSKVTHLLNGEANLIASRSSAAPGNGFMTPAEIMALASHGNVVLRGWGAARLLKPIGHILCVRVCAPLSCRVREIMARMGVDEAKARHEIERSDRSHASAFARLFDTDWRDALNYDIVLNTGTIAPEACASILIDALLSPAFEETDASRQTLADMLLEARATESIKTEPTLRNRTQNVYVSATDGVLQLYGAVSHRGDAGEIELRVREAIGQGELINRIQTMGPFENA